MTSFSRRIAFVVSCILVTGLWAGTGTAQVVGPQVPQVVRNYADKVEPKIRPLLESSFGPMTRKTLISGSSNVTRLFPGLNILLIFTTTRSLPEASTIQAKFKEIVAKLGGEVTRTTVGTGITKTGLQGGKVNVVYKGVTLEGVLVNGQLIGQQGQTDLTFQVTIAR